LGSSLNEQSREDATRPSLIYDKVFLGLWFPKHQGFNALRKPQSTRQEWRQDPCGPHDQHSRHWVMSDLHKATIPMGMGVILVGSSWPMSFVCVQQCQVDEACSFL
jgi:hypothetical protein